MSARPKILYLCTEDWFFHDNRVRLACDAQAAGAEVVVATRVSNRGPRIAGAGLRLVPLGWRRGGLHPLREMRSLIEIVRLYRRERPDLVHHVALKPILYGSVAALLAGRPPAVNMITGLGALFIGSSLATRLLGAIVRPIMAFLLRRSRGWVVTQNPDDRDLLIALGIVAAGRTTVIEGDGVDTSLFTPSSEPPAPPVQAVYVGRMLSDKGLRELVAAARLLKQRNAPVRVVLVGPVDPENLAGIPASEVRAWHAEGVVEWRGPASDVPAVWAAAHIAVLPSYREGLPTALSEAAACGRALVASDVPGCREVVRPGETGLLVPARDPVALADAIERLALDEPLRRRLGAGARRRCEERFAEPIVRAGFLDLYRRLLPGRLATAAREPAPATGAARQAV